MVHGKNVQFLFKQESVKVVTSNTHQTFHYNSDDKVIIVELPLLVTLINNNKKTK